MKYLGNNISYEIDNDIEDKINKFSNICGAIHRNLRNKTRRDTRIKFYKTGAISTLTYASKTWIIKKNVQSAEMKFLQSTLNCRLQDRRRNEDIREELRVTEVNDIISKCRRRWWEHLQRMAEGRLPKAVWQHKPTGRRDVGWPRLRWVLKQAQQPTSWSEEEEVLQWVYCIKECICILDIFQL